MRGGRSAVISVLLVWVIANGATDSHNQVRAGAKRFKAEGSLRDFCIEIRFDTIVSGHRNVENFINNLKKQPTAVKPSAGEDDDSEQILDFDYDSDLSTLCFSFGLDTISGYDHVIFLLRKEYQRLWEEIRTSYNARCKRQVVIIGTSGIGKSAFRFYVLRQWLLGDDLGFVSVVFNAGENYYRVDKLGKVSPYEKQLELDLQSLCLLDPCNMIDKQARLGFGLTVVTSSPPPFTKQQNKYSLSDFHCYTLVMKAWTVGEVRAICPGAKEQRIRDFSYLDEDGEQLCIPKWILMDEMVQVEIVASHDGTSAAALRRLLMAPKSDARDPNLPYSLCRIENRPGKGWAATGFISNYVAKYIHKWACEDYDINIENFNKLIQNPFSHGFFGSIFEDWVKTVLGEKERELEVRLDDGVRNFKFNGVQSYTWRRNKKTGKVSFPHIHLENGVFNKPDGAESPSIDGYAVHSNTLVMVQPTVSLTHSEAKLVAVEDLIAAAKKKGVTSVLMVYVVLLKNFEKFRAPVCPDLRAEGVKVCVGVIPDETDLLAKFNEEIF